MCGITGIFHRGKKLLPAELIVRSLDQMRERGNGLGSGYCGYGIYPEFRDDWAFHIFYTDNNARAGGVDYLKKHFLIKHAEPVPVRPVKTVTNRPIIWRYFLQLKDEVRQEFYDLSEHNIITNCVMEINSTISGAYVVSSGKNMGIFKGVGFPLDIAEFYRLDEYRGYLWIAHNRFPTNTPGWWGGAHPFGLLNFGLVHNGEISSYGINKRYLESFGYSLTLQTDSEAILYLFDLLSRRHQLGLELASRILTAPHYLVIEQSPPRWKKLLTAIRLTYGSALINGPSALIIATADEMIGLTDRIKLRPLVAASDGQMAYLASEESGITAIAKKPKKIYRLDAGIPMIFN